MNKVKIIILSTTVGIFHFFMPLIGINIGTIIISFLPIEAETLEGIIFLILGIQMNLSLYKKEDIKEITGICSIVLFAFTVSIDSLTAGIGIKSITNNYLLATTTFMIISFIATIIGLIIGKKLSEKFGKIATIFGGILLLLLAFFSIF
jgi:putative Mn2+ efflux pump MntP